ncbi:uncharacterized protein si:dkey-201i24.3 isoform X1 [Triplophysa rosa]|uniref:uncharacterized protein si:dkey-201i24.3 isoform X1 n=1 Tax=Triplophysa rosa TaxID=992332 RepID=UPI0025461D29|nr:uncharacterized protein si:dkey-201i24.3 isoform X1 [Triplophysa rosa]
MDAPVVFGGRDEEVGESADIHSLLTQEVDLHVTEGRVGVQKNQERVTHIRQLREHLHKESNQSGCSTSAVEHEKLLECRMRQRETHERVIEDELMKMERELEELQVEGVEGELFYLRRERCILVLQLEALRRENQQAHQDLETQYIQHQLQLNTVREESLRVTNNTSHNALHSFKVLIDRKRLNGHFEFQNWTFNIADVFQRCGCSLVVYGPFCQVSSTYSRIKKHSLLCTVDASTLLCL